MIAELEPFHAISVSHLAHRLAAEGRAVIHMEFGQPSTGAPAPAIAEAHRVLDAEAMGYWESADLRARIAQDYRERWQAEVDPARIVLTCGASPALVTALSLVGGPGARVAFARPGYVAYRNDARALFMTPVEVPCGADARYQLDAAAIAAIDPAPDAVILASPANPTGTVIARDELARIVDLCAGRGIRLIADEIYQGITFGQRATSVLSLTADALVVNSFSKYFSMPGWRLGWLVVPDALIGAARARLGNLFLTPPVIAQRAALAAFDARDELDGHVETYARNRALMLDALPALGLTQIAPPDGAFYIYADVGHLTDDSLDFAMRLLRETGVAIAPGIDFDPVDGHRFIRISFAVATPLVEAALARMIPWFRAQPHK